MKDENQPQVVTVINHGEWLLGRVIGNDFDVGITIVAKNDPSRFLYCYNGPISPNTPVECVYDERDIIIYKDMNNRIKKGIVNLDEFFMFIAKLGIDGSRNISAKTCAFGA